MHAHEDLLIRVKFALHQGQVRVVIDVVGVGNDLEFAARSSGKCGRCGAMNKNFVLHPVLDDIGDGDDFEVVFFREFFEIGHARHGAVVFHDFTDDARRFEPGQSGRGPPILPSGRCEPVPHPCGRGWGKHVPGSPGHPV